MTGDQLDLGSTFDADDAGSRPTPTPRAAGPKRPAVSELTAGTTIESVYLLSSKETRTTKAGKPYFKLRLSDRTGTMDCMVWDTALMDQAPKQGDLVLVTGRVSEYQGRPQLEATKVAASPPGLANPRDFLPSTYRDVEELKGFLRFHLDSVRDPDYAAMLDLIFGDADFFEVFATAPAAKVYHHAYLGGLLEHTVAVAEMCDFVGQQYGRIDRDLLLTAALLHDVGKTRELSFDTTIDFTDAGRFLGHVIPRASFSSCSIAW
jgi:3'-5' exoribonuclease